MGGHSYNVPRLNYCTRSDMVRGNIDVGGIEEMREPWNEGG